MIEQARIETGMKSLPFGGTEFDYTWAGPEGTPAAVDRRMIAGLTDGRLPREFPPTLDLRGIPLRLIPGSENEMFLYVRDAALYVRTDGANVLSWLWHSARARASRPLRWVNVRLILTLYVWGLADWRREEVISWRCVRSRLRRATSRR